MHNHATQPGFLHPANRSSLCVSDTSSSGGSCSSSNSRRDNRRIHTVLSTPQPRNRNTSTSLGQPSSPHYWSGTRTMAYGDDSEEESMMSNGHRLTRSCSFGAIVPGHSNASASLHSQKSLKWLHGTTVLGQGNSPSTSTARRQSGVNSSLPPHVKVPKSPRTERTQIVSLAVAEGLREAVALTHHDLREVHRARGECSALGSQGRAYEKVKQAKRIERYLRQLEVLLSRLEDLRDEYELQRRLRDGVRNMAYAFALSPGKAQTSALTNVRSGFRECTEALCSLEARLEQVIGTLTLEMKGLLGFARLCPGDVFEVRIRHGAQKWKSRGRVTKDGMQIWDNPVYVFKALLGEMLIVKAMEVRLLGTKTLIGQKHCDTKDLFSPHPQLMTVNMNASGSLKLNLVVTWNPLDGDTSKPLVRAPSLCGHTPTMPHTSFFGGDSASSLKESMLVEDEEEEESSFGSISLRSSSPDSCCEPRHSSPNTVNTSIVNDGQILDNNNVSLESNYTTNNSEVQGSNPTWDASGNFTLARRGDSHGQPMQNRYSASSIEPPSTSSSSRSSSPFVYLQQTSNTQMSANLTTTSTNDHFEMSTTSHIPILPTKNSTISSNIPAKSLNLPTTNLETAESENISSNRRNIDTELELSENPDNIEAPGNREISRNQPISGNFQDINALNSQINLKLLKYEVGNVRLTDDTTENPEMKKDVGCSLVKVISVVCLLMEDVRGSFPMLRSLEEAVQMLDRLAQDKLSHHSSTSSITSISIENALECFDFLDSVDDCDTDSLTTLESPLDAFVTSNTIGANTNNQNSEVKKEEKEIIKPASLTGNPGLDTFLQIHMERCLILLQGLDRSGPLHSCESTSLAQLQGEAEILTSILKYKDNLSELRPEYLMSTPRVGLLWECVAKENEWAVSGESVIEGLLPAVTSLLPEGKDVSGREVLESLVCVLCGSHSYNTDIKITAGHFLLHLKKPLQTIVTEETRKISLLKCIIDENLREDLNFESKKDLVNTNNLTLRHTRVLAKICKENHNEKGKDIEFLLNLCSNEDVRKKIIKNCLMLLESKNTSDRLTVCDLLSFLYSKNMSNSINKTIIEKNNPNSGQNTKEINVKSNLNQNISNLKEESASLYSKNTSNALNDTIINQTKPNTNKNPLIKINSSTNFDKNDTDLKEESRPTHEIKDNETLTLKGLSYLQQSDPVQEIRTAAGKALLNMGSLGQEAFRRTQLAANGFQGVEVKELKR